MKRYQYGYAVDNVDSPKARKIKELLQQGVAYHQGGQISEAASSYEKILAVEPENSDAMHLLGLICLQSRQFQKAVALTTRATEISPKCAPAFLSLGAALSASGNKEAALSAFLKAARIDPTNSIHQLNLANTLGELGQSSEALEHYSRVLTLDPESASGWFNQGMLLSSVGRHSEAVDSFRQAIRVAPDLPGRHSNLGVSLAALGEYAQAEAEFRYEILAHPENAEAYRNLGKTLLQQDGRQAEAASLLRISIRLSPNDVAARNLLVRALLPVDLHEAHDLARQTVTIDEGNTEAWFVLGMVEFERGQMKDSGIAFERAHQLEPEHFETMINMATVYFEEERFEEGTACLEEVLRREPVRPESLKLMADTQMIAGDLIEAEKYQRRAIESDPNMFFTHSSLLAAMCYDSRSSSQTLLEESRTWARLHTPVSMQFPPAGARKGSKLKVAYLSPDFRDHPVGRVFEALLQSHNRDRFHVTLYVNQRAADPLTDRIVSFAQQSFFVQHYDDRRLAELIREQEIDILIDLVGHTKNHRLRVFGYKPAPVQVSWLGYFATTGMRQMDYILGDRYVIPDGDERFFVERVVRMPESLYAWCPPEVEIEILPLPAAQTGQITFGCFNNLCKITPESVSLWCSVLREIPGSRLILNRKPLDVGRVRDRYRAMFREQGIDDTRVEFRATSGREAYFGSYADIDIMLDTIPFGGGTTTEEALWMGVPVVNMSTDRMAGHMTESLYHAVGLEELVRNDAQGYVGLAAELAGNIPRLQALRGSLRARVLSSRLCDMRRYARQLEDAFELMWEHRDEAHLDDGMRQLAVA